MSMTIEKLPEPFLGRIVIELIEEDVNAYKRELYGMASDSKIQLVETENERVPYKKGKIIKMAEDAFGFAFEDRYGKDRKKYPKIGDTVMYVPNQTYKLDNANKYHIISDTHVIAFIKGDK